MNPLSKRAGLVLISADVTLTLVLILAFGMIASGNPLHFIQKHPEVLLLLVFFPYSLYLGNLYKVDRKKHPFSYLGRAVTMTCLATAVFHLFHHMTANYEGLDGMSLSLSFSMAVGASFVRGALLPAVMAPSAAVPALVFGGGEGGRRVLDAIRRRPWSGIRAVGIIDNDPAMRNYVYKDIPVLGGSSSLEEVVRRHDVGIIINAAAAAENGDTLPDLSAAADLSVKIFDLPAFYERMTGKVLLQKTSRGWSVGDGAGTVSPDRRVMMFKRGLDTLCAALILLLALPLFAVVAVLLKASSPDPVFVRSERIGKNGKLFHRLSFRTGGTLRPGLRWHAGRLVHLMRLSELPVLVNVLKGEMSFFGPLPETPADMELMKRQNALCDLRLQVRPGVAGWAEVNLCSRGGTLEHDERLGYDLYYVRKASGGLDLKILTRLWRLAFPNM